MFVYVSWTTHSSFQFRAAVRRVVCEMCSQEYFYELLRGGVGESTSLYNLNESGAKEKALAGARKDLAGKLQQGHDPVPCPKCGHVQEAARREVAAIRARRWIGTAFIWLIMLAMIVPASLGIFTVFAEKQLPTFVWWTYAALTLLAIPAILFIYFQRKRFDETSYKLIPDSDPRLLHPPALLPTRISVSGEQQLAPAAPIVPKVSGLKMIAQFLRTGINRDFCLICLAPTENVHHPFLGPDSAAKYRCCETCSRSMTLKCWLGFLGSLVAAVLGCWFMTRSSKIDVYGRIGICFLSMLVLAPTLYFIFRDLTGRVLKAWDIDGIRGWTAIKVRNHQVLERLVQVYSQPELYTVKCPPELLPMLRDQ